MANPERVLSKALGAMATYHNGVYENGNEFDTFGLMTRKCLLDCGIMPPEDFLQHVEADKKLAEHERLEQQTKAERKAKHKAAKEFETTPEMVPRSLQVQLQQARGHKKCTQSQLAQKMGVKSSVVQQWENGKGTLPTPMQRQQLNRLLEIVLQ